MTKLELLKKLHKLAWRDDDYMDQDTLFDIQALIDSEIILEAERDNLKIDQFKNGFIKSIKIVR